MKLYKNGLDHQPIRMKSLDSLRAKKKAFIRKNEDEPDCTVSDN